MKSELSSSISKEAKLIIKQLKKGELRIQDVPDEFATDLNIIKAERTLGLRVSGHRGFDVITQKFFVDEQWFYKDLSNELDSWNRTTEFDCFEDYYDFLDADIYEDACYYQCRFTDELVNKYHLDLAKLMERKSFVTDTIDNYTFAMSQDEANEYKRIEKSTKKAIIRWIHKFNACSTYNEFQKTCRNYEKSTIAKDMSIRFFLVQYAFAAQNDEAKTDLLMEYLSKDYYTGGNDILWLFLIYEPKTILKKYHYSYSSATTNKRRMREVTNFAKYLQKNTIDPDKCGFFSSHTHLYYEQIEYNYQELSISVTIAFESFGEFVEYRNGDLRNCNLSHVYDLDVDFSQYTTDDTTKLPIRMTTPQYQICKTARFNSSFKITQQWLDETGYILKHYEHSFSHFFDFVAFLNGDLSDADLIMCSGLNNLCDINEINLNNAKMTSSVCDKFSIPYEKYCFDQKLIDKFSITEKNEEETAIVLQEIRESNFVFEYNRISYITDLHLMHRINNAHCKSKEDVVYVLQKIVDTIVSEGSKLTLIGGDTSSNFEIFEMFIKILHASSQSMRYVFVLGNHELWDFPEKSINQIVDKYRTLLKENGMYLLHNDLLYADLLHTSCVHDIKIIPYSELIHTDNAHLFNKIRYSRLVILGGLGFSGYNNEFNANNGIYRSSVDRYTEIKESLKFENLYNKLTDILEKKNTVVFTHTPKCDWCSDSEYHDNFLYVSGHTHRNMFHDDGATRVYADNQVGYKSISLHMKSFLMNSDYDYFADYEDGIYEITKQEYQDFARGKNLSMEFNRDVAILYMLKKHNYYCFICKTKKAPFLTPGWLYILNGGQLNKLPVNDIQYYYNNMEQMIATIQTPLNKYTDCQKQIAREIQRIGGSGRIHGCIIDIDFWNHVYVNPVDMKITGYWASNMIDKLVYPNIPALLKEECPELYTSYLNLIESESSNLLTPQQKSDEQLQPQVYLETDIYKTSRVLNKMQKLNSNILTIWGDTTAERYELPSSDITNL